MDDGLKKIYEKEDKRKMQARQAEEPLFKDIDPYSGLDWDEKRMDIIGQNGNDGEHYEKLNRGNWWGLADDWDTEEDWLDNDKYFELEDNHLELDATGMDDDDPNPKEGPRGNYEL